MTKKKYTAKQLKTRAAKKKRILEKLEEAREQLDAMHESDPFWFFEPSDGSIPEKGRKFLEKHLKPEDIPAKLDGQTDVFMSEAPIRGASGGNQSGKSTDGAVEAYVEITGELPTALKGIYPEHRLRDIDDGKIKAVRVVCVSNKQFLNTVKPTYQKWVPREYLLKGRWKDSYSAEQNTLKLYKPGTDKQIGYIEFMTNNQDVTDFQGPPLDMVIYDEEPKEEIYKENLLRFVTAERLNILFCWTPTLGLTWTAEKFSDDEDERGNKVELFKLCTVTNKCANLDVVDEIIDEIDNYEEKKMRLLGEFISLSGLVYGNSFNRKVHVIKPFYEHLERTKAYRDYVMLTGMDPHLVTSSAMDFVLVDREGNCYVDLCWDRTAEVDEIKSDWHKIVKERNYRAGWSVADKSSDSSIVAFGGLNIFKELRTAPKNIAGLRQSIKFEGSIKAGVNEMKQRLRGPKIEGTEKRGLPTLYIVDRPENKKLISSFRTLERDTYPNEDAKGPKDKIKEGKHHLHAALRYIFQFPVCWYPAVDEVPESDYANYA
jgi:phage terminase large subunit-like protein